MDPHPRSLQAGSSPRVLWLLSRRCCQPPAGLARSWVLTVGLSPGLLAPDLTPSGEWRGLEDPAPCSPSGLQGTNTALSHLTLNLPKWLCHLMD